MTRPATAETVVPVESSTPLIGGSTSVLIPPTSEIVPVESTETGPTPVVPVTCYYTPSRSTSYTPVTTTFIKPSTSITYKTSTSTSTSTSILTTSKVRKSDPISLIIWTLLKQESNI